MKFQVSMALLLNVFFNFISSYSVHAFTAQLKKKKMYKPKRDDYQF